MNSADLPCPGCDSAYSPKALLEGSAISWPELNWINFSCPSCGESTHILIEDGRMATVDLLGAPGPDWEINVSIEVCDLTTRMDPGFAHVWLNGKHYEFEAKK